MKICGDMGVPIAEENTTQPTQNIVFLGIEFYTLNMIMKSPPSKLRDSEHYEFQENHP
jgi:hypothetical protein